MLRALPENSSRKLTPVWVLVQVPAAAVPAQLLAMGKQQRTACTHVEDLDEVLGFGLVVVLSH